MPIVNQSEVIVQDIMRGRATERDIEKFVSQQVGPDKKWVWDRMKDDLELNRIFEQIGGGEKNIPFFPPMGVWLTAAGEAPLAKAKFAAEVWDDIHGRNTFNKGQRTRAFRRVITTVPGFKGRDFRRALVQEIDRMGLPPL